MSVEPELAAQAVAAAGDVIITADRTGKITSWNGAAERLFGHSEKEAVGQSLALIVPAEYAPRHVAGFEAAMSSGRLAHGGAVARVEAADASGTRRALGMSLGLLHDEDGQVSGVVAVLRPLAGEIVEFVPAPS